LKSLNFARSFTTAKNVNKATFKNSNLELL
jgi:hypothetical protein